MTFYFNNSFNLPHGFIRPKESVEPFIELKVVTVSCVVKSVKGNVALYEKEK